MKNIEDINKAAVAKILASKKITDFGPGDTIKVGVKIIEGKKERIQYFEGVCIAKKNRDINSSLPTKYAKKTFAIPKEIRKKINHFVTFFLIFSAILADLPVRSLR